MKKTRKLLCATEVHWGTTKLYMGSGNGSWTNEAWISIDHLDYNPTIANIWEQQ